jgi:hypothetical protein
MATRGLKTMNVGPSLLIENMMIGLDILMINAAQMRRGSIGPAPQNLEMFPLIEIAMMRGKRIDAHYKKRIKILIGLNQVKESSLSLQKNFKGGGEETTTTGIRGGRVRALLIAVIGPRSEMPNTARKIGGMIEGGMCRP